VLCFDLGGSAEVAGVNARVLDPSHPEQSMVKYLEEISANVAPPSTPSSRWRREELLADLRAVYDEVIT
jgi:hypothetical protein